MVNYNCPLCSEDLSSQSSLQISNGIESTIILISKCICGYDFHSPANTLAPVVLSYPNYNQRNYHDKLKRFNFLQKP